MIEILTMQEQKKRSTQFASMKEKKERGFGAFILLPLRGATKMATEESKTCQNALHRLPFLKCVLIFNPGSKGSQSSLVLSPLFSCSFVLVLRFNGWPWDLAI